MVQKRHIQERGMDKDPMHRTEALYALLSPFLITA